MTKTLPSERISRSGPGTLLLVEDDPLLARVLTRALTKRGFGVHTEATVEAARNLLQSDGHGPSFALIDLNLAGESGLKLIDPIRQRSPSCRILILTGYASVATAVDAIKLGADHYLAKPADMDTITRSLLGEQAPDIGAVSAVPLSMQEVEWEHIQRVLRENNGNISWTARVLHMHRRTLQRKLLRPPCADAGAALTRRQGKESATYGRQRDPATGP